MVVLLTAAAIIALSRFDGANILAVLRAGGTWWPAKCRMIDLNWITRAGRAQEKEAHEKDFL
jgi:hypothetical protein